MFSGIDEKSYPFIVTMNRKKPLLQKGRIYATLKYFVQERLIWSKDGLRMKPNKI
jgi:hypothetical protein